MGNVIGVPVTYALRRTLANENGCGVGRKEVVAFRQLNRASRKRKKRLDLYNPFFSEDYVEMGIFIPEQEKILEYRKLIPTSESEIRESIFFCGFNSKNENLAVNISLNGEGLASAWLLLSLSNGKTYSQPLEKFYRVPRTGKESFAAGPLRIKCLLPMRRWRISFNGLLLEEDDTTNTKKAVHVKFTFIWTASSDIFDVKSDIPHHIMAKFLSTENWSGNSPNIEKYLESLDSYVQAGNMTGTVQLESGDEEVKHFWGTRKRSHGDFRNPTVRTKVEYFGYMSEGEMIYLGDCRSSSENSSSLQYGCIVMANSLGGPMDKIKINSSDNSKTAVDFSFEKFKWTGDFESADFRTTVNDFQRSQVLQFCPVTLNGLKGRGLIISFDGFSDDKIKESQKIKRCLPLLEEMSEAAVPLVLSLKDVACRQPAIAGGKGSSLTDLHLLSEMDKSFSVPNGVAITTTAYSLFIQQCNIGAQLERFQKYAGKLQPEDFQKECVRVSKELQECVLLKQIKDDLQNELIKIFGSDFEYTNMAVRSSATGEDSEEMSAAGQMKTFLGVQGMNQICEAIVKCWASQFEFIACQYKRQNGQLLNSPMSVVVQQIVEAESAGVMFTCDPVNGDPRKITITSNYGIGESVVSATAEPDTIILSRSLEDEVQLESITLGRKNTMTVLKDGGSCEETVSEDISSKCSLSEDLALRLAEIGIRVEEAYGCRMDIEWAVKGGIMFLLQARPVTTFDRESNFEIMHECDVSYRAEKEWNSMGNAGEVFPGATSNLSITSVCKFCFELLPLRLMGKRCPDIFPYSPYFRRDCGTFANHMMFNLTAVGLRNYKGAHNSFTRSQHISMFGRIIDEERALEMATYRNKFEKSVIPVRLGFFILKELWSVGDQLRKYSQSHRGLQIDISQETSLENMFLSIIRHWIILQKPFSVHFKCAFSSLFSNHFLCSTLVAGNNGEWNQDVFNDVAYILSCCSQVESAQVPLELEKLAKAVVNDYGTGFDLLDCKEALKWLEGTDLPCGEQFGKFLKTNGHRCFKEFDLYSKPWGSDPLPVVKIIQDLVNSVDKVLDSKVQLTTEETMNNLKTHPNCFRRLLLRIAIPLSRKAVGYREGAKSLFISLINSLRGAYQQMAERMVLEGFLPSADVFYFLEHHEVAQLLETRSPKLVQKAIRRRNMFPEMDKMVLPEMIEGFPVPINYETEEVVIQGSVCVKGVPVSQGVAVGRAIVATSLKEAAEIQQGDILIAYSTDIGWSPYFTLLAGVATELGGIISHGAVIAREYGLPCVIAAQGATRKFRTGDKVQIDGNKGTITRIE